MSGTPKDYRPAQYSKATAGGVIGALVAVCSVVATGLQDGRLSTLEIVLAVGAGLTSAGASFGAVFGVQNAPHQ